MPQTIVINNREALEIGQMPHLGRDKSGAPMIGDTITLYPGLNLVDSEKLKVLRQNKLFGEKFSTKIPRSAAPEQNPEKVGEPILVAGKELPDEQPFAKLPPKEVCDLIEEMCMIGALRELLKAEGRSDVRAAVLARIDFLDKGGQPYGTSGR